MKTVVINGANGYVASHFISNLLKQKYKVVALVRTNKRSPQERMKKVLADINDGEKVLSGRVFPNKNQYSIRSQNPIKIKLWELKK